MQDAAVFALKISYLIYRASITYDDLSCKYSEFLIDSAKALQEHEFADSISKCNRWDGSKYFDWCVVI
jgi:hypothetical protein